MTASPQPTFGHPVPRDGKPYIWATWLAKLLGGDHHCQWAAWFKAHYRHKKFEKNAAILQEWNRDHTDLMRQVRAELEEHGWTVRVENENDFKLDGAVAIVAGKPDIVATMPGHALIVDGKTGRRRDSDWWQLLLYLYAYALQRRLSGRTVVGEVRYRVGTVTVQPAVLTEERKELMVQTIKLIASPTAPARRPSRYECDRCDIGFADCPERVREDVARELTTVSDF